MSRKRTQLAVLPDFAKAKAFADWVVPVPGVTIQIRRQAKGFVVVQRTEA